MKSKMMAIVTVAAVIFTSTVASAATFTWLGTGGDNSWYNTANWDPAGLPTPGTTGDIVIINGVTTPTLNPTIGATGAMTQQLYIRNDGVLNITAGTNGDWGLSTYGSPYNSVDDGTLNVSGSYKMNQNLYIGHTDTVGSYGTVNILPGGIVQTRGVLTVAGRYGSGEMNIWGTYLLGGIIRWEFVPREGMVYSTKVRLYEGGLFSWTGDRISTDEIGSAIRNGHLVSGVAGHEISAVYDADANSTNVMLTVPEPVMNPTQTECIVTWTTYGPATSQIEYGLTESYGSVTPLQTQLITSHTVNLTGLTPNTIYHCRVKSKDAAGNELVSADSAFSTLPSTQITPGGSFSWDYGTVGDWDDGDGRNWRDSDQFAGAFVDEPNATSVTQATGSNGTCVEGPDSVCTLDTVAGGWLSTTPATRLRVFDGATMNIVDGADLCGFGWIRVGDIRGATNAAYLNQTGGRIFLTRQRDRAMFAIGDGNSTPGMLPGSTYTISGGTLTYDTADPCCTGQLILGQRNGYGQMTIVGRAPVVNMRNMYIAADILGGEQYDYGTGILTFRFGSGGVSSIHLTGTAYIDQGDLIDTDGDGVGDTQFTTARLGFENVAAAPAADILLIDASSPILGTFDYVEGDSNGGRGEEGDTINIGSHAYMLTYGGGVDGEDLVLVLEPDTTVPDTQIISGPSENGTVCSLPVDFSWTGADDITPTAQLSYSYQMDGQGWNSFSSATSTSYSDLADGLHTFEVKAKDSSGNEEATPAVRHFTIDASGNPPQVSNVSVSVGQLQATISWTTDKAASSQVEYGLTDSYGLLTPLDNNLVINHAVTIIGLTPKTTYYYRVRSKDGCGRESTHSDDVFVTAADTTPPETSVTSGPANGGVACEGTVEVCWLGSDNYCPVGQLVYAYRMDSGTWSAWDASTCKSFTLGDGQHTLEVKARDGFGNEDQTPAGRTFRVDTITPSISNVRAVSQAGSAVITWSTDEDSTSQVEYGPDTNYGFTTPLASELTKLHSVTIGGLEPTTEYHFRVRSQDACGRETVSDDLGFQTLEDTTAPDTQFTSGPADNGKACDTTASFCWSGSDDVTPVSGLQYSFRMDDGEWSAWTSETCHAFSSLPEGLHTVLVKARDARGNIDSTPAYRNFYVDMTPPVISGLTVTPRDYRATVVWNTSEPATSLVEYGATADYGISSSMGEAMNGMHTVTIRGLMPQTTYHFRVRSSDGCRETMSDDQVFTTTDILLPNLSIVSLEAIDTTIAMATIDVSWRVKNEGPGDIVGGWSDGFYLSTDPTLDDGDIPIETIQQDVLLPEDLEHWRSKQLQMPLVPEGNYYLIIKTDAGQSVAETDEGNNILVKPIEFLHVKTMVVSPSEIPLNLNPGVAIDGQLDIGNLGATPLSAITAVVENASQNIAVQITVPPALDSMQKTKVHYTIIASDESVLQNSPIVRFTSGEGEEATVTFNIRVIPMHPSVVVSPAYLEAGMLRGAQTLVECEVINNGAVPASDVGVQLPSVPWMSLVTPENMGVILPGEKRKIAIQLTPPEDIQLGPYAGNIAIIGGNTSASIGFRFTAISDRIGGLRITAKDEFTYYAENNPPVAGAKVELKDVSTGEVLVQDVTDNNGICQILQLTEGYYNLEVSVEKHGTYRSTVEIRGGQLKEVLAFLPRQLVTYTWNVVPVDTEDRYEVTLEAVFETHVPAPVVTVEPMVLDLTKLTFDADGEAVANYTITNYGFIGVKDVKIQFGTHSKYRLAPLVENIGNLNGLSSMVVPVTITDLDIMQASGHLTLAAGVTSPSTSGSTNPCGVSGSTQYTYNCGGDITGLIPLTVVTGQCPSSGTPYISGGGGGSSGGGGGGAGITPPVYNIQVDCNPCASGCLSSLAGCIPGVGCALGLIQCGVKFNTSNPMQTIGSLLHCNVAVVGCLEEIDPILGCLCTIARDCVVCDKYGGPEKAPWWPCSLSDILDRTIDHVIPRSSGSTVASGCGVCKEQGLGSTVGDYFLEQYYRVAAVPAMLAYILGDAKWLDISEADKGKLQPWLETFYSMTVDESDAGSRLSEAELSSLLSLERPTQIDTADVQKFVARWNRTVDYYSRGILSENDLPSGWDPDFIALDKVKALYDFIVQAEQDVRSQGFDGLVDALIYARGVLVEEKMQASEGVCSRVKIQIDQQVAITRTAFKATLEIENAPENVVLENIRVVLDIRDSSGTASNDRFGIRAPELTSISDVNGTGAIIPGITASAVWTIIPARDAAPDAPTQYFVGGTLEYDQGATHVSIPLFPAPILVKPDPLLTLDYFLVRDVYSDDPFTPQIEPAEPFSLGLLMANRGKGTARNVRITSSQPKIIENDKDLLIDFKITGTQVNDEPTSPSLTVNLGDIGPAETAVAQWIMICSLQGKFVDYQATFEHIDGLGEKRLSLIDSVNIHELTHVVRVDIPADDGKPDFLANEIPDANHQPDALYNSDGSTAIVNLGVGTSIEGSVTTISLQTQVHSTVPSGWVYIRTSDPGMDQFRLVRAVRSDGREIMVGDNAWTTHRTVRLVGQPEYREHLLHIFDKDSAGSYTLTYEEIAPDVTPPMSSVMPLPPEEASPIFTVCWSGEDNAGGSGLKNFDVYVSDNLGPWQLWQSNVIIRCASYVGLPGHSYRFFSIARDVAGNIETPPAEPDASTWVFMVVTPRAEFAAGHLDITTQRYAFAVTYFDNKGIDVSTLGSSNIRVTGPGGFSQAAEFVDANGSDDGSPRTGHYRFGAPGGTWDAADNGVYCVWMLPNQVDNTMGQYVPGGILKTFKITDSFAGQLVLESYNLISVTRVGRTTFDYIFTVTLYNSSRVAVSNVDFRLFGTPANMTILDPNVSIPYINHGKAATSERTLRIRVDRSVKVDLYALPWRVAFEPERLAADFNGDGRVDLVDIGVFADKWLQNDETVDIAPPPSGDGIVDFLDYAVLAGQWLQSVGP